MQVKLIAILFAVLMFSGMAFAADPVISVLNRDGNYFYPAATNTIEWDVSDADAPVDFNFIITYVDEATFGTSVEITSATGADGAPDRNRSNFCTDAVGVATQKCSFTWTLPTGLDANYFIDINGYSIDSAGESPDDVNALSGSLYFDTNACTTEIGIVSDTVTLTTVCSGFGTTGTTYFGYSRIGRCPDRFEIYSSPFSLSFGEFTICAYSTDNIGNTEATVSALHTASSSAFNLALLAEMLLAALLLVFIIGAFVIRGEALDAKVMIALLIAAVVIAISIYIYALIL